MFCSDAKRQEFNETNDDHLVEAHKRLNEMRLRQADTGTPNVSTSVEMIDTESSEESLTNSSSSSSRLSENGSNVALPKAELESMVICGRSCPPGGDANSIVVREAKAKHWKKKFSLNSKIEGQLQKGIKKGQETDSRNSSPKKSSCAPPTPVRHFSYTAPPLPRPSPWKEVYLTMIKPKEQLAEESFKKKVQKNRVKRRHVNREEQIRVLRTQLAKKIDSIKRKASYIRRHNTPDNQMTEHDNNLDGDLSDKRSSTSISPASTCSSSAAPRSSSINSDESFEESYASVSRYYRGTDESAVTGATTTGGLMNQQ